MINWDSLIYITTLYSYNLISFIVLYLFTKKILLSICLSPLLTYLYSTVFALRNHIDLINNTNSMAVALLIIIGLYLMKRKNVLFDKSFYLSIIGISIIYVLIFFSPANYFTTDSYEFIIGSLEIKNGEYKNSSANDYFYWGTSVQNFMYMVNLKKFGIYNPFTTTFLLYTTLSVFNYIIYEIIKKDNNKKNLFLLLFIGNLLFITNGWFYMNTYYLNRHLITSILILYCCFVIYDVNLRRCVNFNNEFKIHLVLFYLSAISIINLRQEMFIIVLVLHAILNLILVNKYNVKKILNLSSIWIAVNSVADLKFLAYGDSNFLELVVFKFITIFSVYIILRFRKKLFSLLNRYDYTIIVIRVLLITFILAPFTVLFFFKRSELIYAIKTIYLYLTSNIGNWGTGAIAFVLLTLVLILKNGFGNFNIFSVPIIIFTTYVIPLAIVSGLDAFNQYPFGSMNRMFFHVFPATICFFLTSISSQRHKFLI
jgi:hypothetical protein